MKVVGKLCVVTGGSSGLGLATTQHLLRLGAYVAVIDLSGLDESAVSDTSKVRVYKTNVARTEEVSAAVGKITEWSKSSGLDIMAVICCAGLLGPAKIISKNGTAMSIEHFKKVIDVSLIGTVDVIRQLLPHMSRQKGDIDGERGVIITVSSAAAFDGQPGQTAYSAAKGGLASMALPLARDLAPLGIRSVCIAPAMFETNMTSKMPQKAQDSIKQAFEFPARSGRPDEFSSLVVHAIENTMLNGTVIRIDGAMRLPSRL